MTRLVTFLLLPYYSFRLSPAEYGEITLYFLFIAVTQTFFIYGFDIAFLRYFTLSKRESERREITGTAILTSLISSAFLLLLITAAAPLLGGLLIRNPVHPEITPNMIRVCAGILFFDTLTTFPFLMLRATHKPLWFTVIKLLNVLINISLNIYFVGSLKWSVKGVLLANLAASSVTFLILLPYAIRRITPVIRRINLKEMFVFGLPNVPTYLFVMVVELADRKIIEAFRGLEEAGLYSAGYKLGMFMAVVTAAFRFAWQPFFLSHADDENAPVLFARVLTYYLLVAGTLFLMLTYYIGPIIRTDLPAVGHIIAPEYWAGLCVFPLILLAHIFDGIYANLMVGVYLKKLTRRLPLVTGSAAAVTILLNLLLIPRYGMMAAACVTVLAFALQAFLLWLVVRKPYPVPYEITRIIKLAVVLGLLYFLSTLSVFSELWIRTLLLVSLPVFLYLSAFFTVDEKRFLRGIVGIR